MSLRAQHKFSELLSEKVCQREAFFFQSSRYNFSPEADKKSLELTIDTIYLFFNFSNT